jgi:hypothetical protein
VDGRAWSADCLESEMMMTWLLQLRHDRECDHNHIRRTLVLDLLRVAGRAEVAPPEGDDHKTKQNYRNRFLVDARPSRRVYQRSLLIR